MGNDTCPGLQRTGKFWQCNVTILRDQLFQKRAVRRELAAPFGPSLGMRRQIALLAKPPKPANPCGR